MNKTIHFRQSELIEATGRQNPGGICLGLTVQWLVAISKGFTGEEQRFWDDLNSSKASNEKAPLLGMGYAKEAIQFQNEYGANNNGIGSSDYARKVLIDHELKIESAQGVKDYNALALRDIAHKVLTQDGRYTLLLIKGDEGAHAIGIYRKYSLYGKSADIAVFDSNQGKWEAVGEGDTVEAIANAMYLYRGWTNLKYSLETFA